jgi:hypothetical protein
MAIHTPHSTGHRIMVSTAEEEISSRKSITLQESNATANITLFPASQKHRKHGKIQIPENQYCTPNPNLLSSHMRRQSLQN